MLGCQNIDKFAGLISTFAEFLANRMSYYKISSISTIVGVEKKIFYSDNKYML